MLRALAFLALSFTVGSAAAQTTYTWAGGTSGSWQTPTNWTPQGVPGVADEALFETSANVTLTANTWVKTLSAVGRRAAVQPGTFAGVTISSSTSRFVSMGTAQSARGSLTVSARVDTCGSAVAFASATESAGGQTTLQNVGGVGAVSSSGHGVTLNGSSLRIGDVTVNGGPLALTGTVYRVGNVNVNRSLRDGPGSVVVTSAPVAGGTRLGQLSVSSGGTVDVQADEVVAEAVLTIDPEIAGSSNVVRFAGNASVAVLGGGRTSIPTVRVGGTLRVAQVAYGPAPGILEAIQPGATVVIGAGASASSPALFNPLGNLFLANGLNLRFDGPTAVNSGNSSILLQLNGGTLTVSAGARLRTSALSVEVRGTGAVVIDGELSVAAAVAGRPPTQQPSVVVTVPAQVRGTLNIDLSGAERSMMSNVSFAQLTAGGTLAFTYPASATAPFAIGSSFTPFTYTSVTGAFGLVTFPPLLANRAWSFALEPTRARLVVLGQAPAPVNDEVVTDEDVPVSFDPAANDTAANGGALRTVAIGPSSLGQVTLSGGTVTFTPRLNAFGDETVAYTVREDNGLESTGAVHLVVRPVNDAPVAVDDAAETQEAVVVQIDVLANDTDVDGPALSIASVEPPSVGNAFRSEGKILYSPPTGFTGTVTFGYTVTDGSLSDEGRVTVTVRPFTAGETAPVAVAISAPSPNPSAGPVMLRVSLPVSARVTVDVFDALGRRVPSAMPDVLPAGVTPVVLASGLPPGTYFYRVRVEGEAASASGQFVVVR